MQLPPAFSLPHDEKIGRAIELAYDRDFSHIPLVTAESQYTTERDYPSWFRVLSSQRRPLGYIDVSALKAQWEAGKATPVRNFCSSVGIAYIPFMSGGFYIALHDQVQTGTR
jgi:hypothetical protein